MGKVLKQGFDIFYRVSTKQAKTILYWPGKV